MQRCATGISSKVLSLRGKANFRAFSSLLSSVDELMGMFQEPKAQRSKSGTTKPCQLKSELALKISRKYPSLPSLQGNLVGCERLDILMYLSSTCYPLEEKFIQAVKTFHKDQDIALPQVSTSQHLFLLKLRQLSTPTYEVLIDYIMKQDILSGMEFIISLRMDLLQTIRILKATSVEDDRLTHLKVLNQYLHRLLSLWFCPGMLELRRITYDGTSASIIELIAKKEAVHPLQSLDDLRSRLGPGRRVFALFSPLLPDRPLVFCHVFLSDEIPSCMSQVLGVSEEKAKPRVATFYSISNSQPGLAGLQLGEYLLKNGINKLQEEFPSIESFVTLSPIPNFRKWLTENAEVKQKLEGNVTFPEETNQLESIMNGNKAMDEMKEEELSSLNAAISKLACQYLLFEKDTDGKVACRVARFHIGNGALVHRVNFNADQSRKGVKESFTMMVNYKYDMTKISENQAGSEMDNHIPASPEILHFLKD